MYKRNKERQKQQAREHYLRNKDKIKARAKSWTKNRINLNKEIISNIKKSNNCVDCGESNPIVLEFDHVSGDKTRDVSRAVSQGWSSKRLLDEIAKCEIRCANCHRIKTYNELWTK